MQISRSIVDAVRSLNPPGRFLEKDPETRLYSDIGERKAIEKTSQALRDGASSLRKQLSEDLGDPDFLTAVFDGDSTSSFMDKTKSLKTKAMKKGHRRTKSTPDAPTVSKHKSPVRKMKLSDHPLSPNMPQRRSIPLKAPRSQPASPMDGRRRGPYAESPSPPPFPSHQEFQAFQKSNRPHGFGASSIYRSHGGQYDAPYHPEPPAQWHHGPARHHGCYLSPVYIGYPPPPYQLHPSHRPTSPDSNLHIRRPPLSPGDRSWSSGTFITQGQSPRPMKRQHSPPSFTGYSGSELSVPPLERGGHKDYFRTPIQPTSSPSTELSPRARPNDFYSDLYGTHLTSTVQDFLPPPSPGQAAHTAGSFGSSSGGRVSFNAALNAGKPRNARSFQNEVFSTKSYLSEDACGTSPTVVSSDIFQGSLSGKSISQEISKKLKSETETDSFLCYPTDEDDIEGVERALSPLPYDRNDVGDWMDMPDDLLKLPIASCGPYDVNMDASVRAI
jgi:hypothetical protein